MGAKPIVLALPERRQAMKSLGRIIAFSIAVGFILVVGLIIVATYLMGYNVAERRDRELENRDKIIERIDSFRSENGHLPELMSEVGFRQTCGGGYYYKGIIFDYIKLNDKEYVVEYTSEDGVLTQYHDHCWTEEPDICLIEMPVTADTIAAINRISKFEQDYNVPPLIDSISFNRSRICPIGDYTGQPDSIAYIRYLYNDGSIRCEGWVAYFDDPEDDFSNPFGEWKYYDQEGNCYRKFWNHKQNGKLIYETDR